MDIDTCLRSGDLSQALVLADTQYRSDGDLRSGLLYAQIQSFLDPDAADEFMAKAFRERRRDPNAYNIYSQYLAFRGDFSRSRLIVLDSFDLPMRMPMMIQQLMISQMLCPEKPEHDFLMRFKRIVSDNCGVEQPGFDHSPGKPRFNVGFVSAALYCHPMSFFIEKIFRNLDRKKFLLTVFSSTRKSDDYTQALSQLVDVWYDVQDLSDNRLMEMIRSERVDVLIDLDSHTEFNRLSVFAARCAPVQISVYALNASTGVGAMDYRLTDFLVDPVGLEDEYSERLIRTSGSHIGYSPLDVKHKVGVSPMYENGFVTFGSFNSQIKLNIVVFRAWLDILNRLPGSRLRLYGIDKAIREAQFREWVRECGVDADRVSFFPRIAVPSLISAMQSVDIALDTWPYGGGVTSAMTLSAGVPILTVEGDRAVSRVTSSMLRRLQLEEWIAVDPESLIQIALDRIKDTEFDRLRVRIQDDFYHKFVDSKRDVEEFGIALIRAIEVAKQKKAPQSMMVG